MREKAKWVIPLGKRASNECHVEFKNYIDVKDEVP